MNELVKYDVKELVEENKDIKVDISARICGKFVSTFFKTVSLTAGLSIPYKLLTSQNLENYRGLIAFGAISVSYGLFGMLFDKFSKDNVPTVRNSLQHLKENKLKIDVGKGQLSHTIDDTVGALSETDYSGRISID